MPAWERRKEERKAAAERSLIPYVAPERTETSRGQRRGAAPQSLAPTQGLDFSIFQGSQISTPSRGGTSGRGQRKPVEKVDAPISQAPDTRLGSVDTPTPYPTEAVTKPVPTGRDTSPPDGSTAKGTSMGSSVLQMDEVNKILNGRGVPALTDPFSSNNLPGVDYSGEDAAVMGRSRQDSAVIGLRGSVETTFDGSKPPVSVLQHQGSPELVADGAISADSPGSAALSPASPSIPNRPSGARQAEKWDRKYGGADFGGQSEAPATSGFDMERRRAFLSADSGLRGMEAVKAQKGMATFGGQSYIVDPNNEGQMMAISQQDKGTLLGRDQQKAQDLLGSYVKAIKPDEEDPAV